MDKNADALIEQLTLSISELIARRIEEGETIERLTKALASQTDQKAELLKKSTQLAWDLERARQVRDEAQRQSSLNVEKAREILILQHRVAQWVKERIGPKAMAPAERAMRLLEEALELAQAHGIDMEMVRRQTEHVYGREPGEPKQEAGGVAVCLLGWCAAVDFPFLDVARAEVERIEALPTDSIRGSLARKNDADLFVSAIRAEGETDGR